MESSSAPASEPAISAALQAFRAGDAAQARTLAHALADGAAPHLVAEAAMLLARLARRQGQLDLALAESDRAIAAAHAAGDPARECRAHVQRCHALNALGRTEAAAEASDGARRLAQESGDDAAEAAALEAVAAIQWSMARWSDALASFGKMLDAATAGGDLELQAVAHGDLSGVEGELAKQFHGAEGCIHRERA